MQSGSTSRIRAASASFGVPCAAGARLRSSRWRGLANPQFLAIQLFVAIPYCLTVLFLNS